jgi:hypothetical protein
MSKSQVISVPLNRVEAVEAVLGRSIIRNQVPVVKIRVAIKDLEKVRKAIKNV